MSNAPRPKGKEKKLLLRLKDLFSENPIPDPLQWDYSIENDVGFALDGLRCNGTEEPTTLIDLIMKVEKYADAISAECTSYSNRLQNHLSSISKNRDSILAEFHKRFKICTSCNGSKGTGNSGNLTWKDCSVCNGKGFTKH